MKEMDAGSSISEIRRKISDIEQNIQEARNEERKLSETEDEIIRLDKLALQMYDEFARKYEKTDMKELIADAYEEEIINYARKMQELEDSREALGARIRKLSEEENLLNGQLRKLLET